MITAANHVLLALSEPCALAANPCKAFNSCLNLPITTMITKPDSRIITNAKKIMIGAEAKANAGWVKYNTVNVAQNNSKNPPIWP